MKRRTAILAAVLAPLLGVTAFLFWREGSPDQTDGARDHDPIRAASKDNVLVAAIALTGWKGKTRQQLQEMLARHREEFERAVADRGIDSLMGLTISRSGGQVDFADSLCGLRYVYDRASMFEPDSEYLIVDRLSQHWFVFERDWN